MNTYEERLELRRQRLEDRADRLNTEGAARLKTGRDALALIPFGQPMLIGHHSYNRDRNYRNRAQNNMAKGFEAMKAADEVAQRAAAVGTGGVSSDDPEAVTKLQEQLTKLEAKQAQMVAINKLVRKGDRAGLAELGFSETMIANLFTPQWGDRGPIGLPAYELTNNNANVRRIKLRIEQLTRNATRETVETVAPAAAGDVRLVENAELNRVQLFFPGKPDADVRSKLKSAGFRWSPSESAWQRQLNNRAVWVAKSVLEEITPKEVTP